MRPSSMARPVAPQYRVQGRCGSTRSPLTNTSLPITWITIAPYGLRHTERTTPSDSLTRAVDRSSSRWLGPSAHKVSFAKCDGKCAPPAPRSAPRHSVCRVSRIKARPRFGAANAEAGRHGADRAGEDQHWAWSVLRFQLLYKHTDCSATPIAAIRLRTDLLGPSASSDARMRVRLATRVAGAAWTLNPALRAARRPASCPSRAVLRSLAARRRVAALCRSPTDRRTAR
jgi:hypothetical protein